MINPMRVLLTADTVGGVWQYSLDLAGALGEQDVDTVVAVLGPPPSDRQRAEAAALPRSSLVETGLPLDWLCNAAEPVVAAGAAIARLADERSVDLVQLNSPALAASCLPNAPVVAVAHGCLASWWQAAAPEQPLPHEFRWHRSLVSQGLRAAARVVAPSAAYAAMIARLYRLSEEPAVVHNGRRPFSVGASAVSHDSALTVGRLWDRVKNAELLERVAARLSIPFHAAGPIEGPHGQRVSLQQLNWLGSLDAGEIGRQLASRPIFVSAARFEPFGLAVLEAASAGCALVLSDIATFRELWEGAAIFVPAEDEVAYARAIDAILGDALLRRRLGRTAAERAQRYTPAAMGAAMAGLYRTLLQRDQPNDRAAA